MERLIDFMELNVRNVGAVVIVLCLITVAIAAVMFAQRGDNDLPSGTLPSFETESQLMDFIRERGPDSPSQLSGFGSDKAEDSGSNYHTGTNVQVAGIDEIDRIKTDGTYIYIASSDRVSVVLAYPSEAMSNVSEILIGDMLGTEGTSSYILGIYLSDEILIVICNVYSYSEGPWVIPGLFWSPGSDKTIAVLLDVSDPYSPDVLRTAGISGYSIGSRLIDSKLYVISQESVWNYDQLELPTTEVDGSVKDVPATDIMFDPNCTRVSTFTNFCVIDLVNMSVNSSSILTDYSCTIYVSMESIYLTFVEWRWDAVTWTEDDVAVSSDINEVTTSIFKLDISTGNVLPVAVGTVEGYPLNQFSMDEKDGMLRIATCSGWSQRENMVFILDEEMNIIGDLRGIALNETIQSARFMGDTLYLVTFLQVDPLFVIDLSDPEEPKVLGELVVPGFSTYLHPVGDGLLVGIGLDNWTLKVSLYDVSVPEAPVEVETIMADVYAWSSALWDHKAVMFDPMHGLLAIPVYSYANDMMYSEEMFVISVGEDGLELEARLTNGNMESSPRGMVIEDTFYTITTTSIVAWDITSFEKIGDLTFTDEPTYYWYYWGAEDGATVR